MLIRNKNIKTYTINKIDKNYYFINLYKMWKSIFVSLFLQTKRYTYILNNQCTSYDYGEFLNINKKLISKNINTSNFSIPGNDDRYNFTDNKKKLDQEVLLNITKFIIQSDLLKKINNNKTSLNDKIKLIDQYNQDYGDTSISDNIESGGLYNDWNFVIL